MKIKSLKEASNCLKELRPVVHLENFSLHFSSSSFAIRVNLRHP